MYKYLVLKSMKSIYLFAIVCFLFSCDSPVASQNKNPSLYETEAFKNYWYKGKAEVNSYNLLQSRYGEVREGKAMLLFVTEDFSKKKQVKLDVMIR
jgi:hypothetical protein